MTEEERLSKYTMGYFYGGEDGFDVDFSRALFHQRLLRIDQISAICGAYGCYDVNLIRYAYGMGYSYVKQVEPIKMFQRRTPKLVVDVGSGRGELSAAFLNDDIRCISIEPALQASDIFFDTLNHWSIGSKGTLINAGAYEGLSKIREMDDKPDTIIFCESLEHIPEKEGDAAINLAAEMLTETEGRLIIANYEHPIIKQGDWPPTWDHIRTIDDDVYDRICSLAPRIIFRDNGYLGLGFW